MAFTASHLKREGRDYSADAVFRLGLELALDKTPMKQTHVYITEALLPPNKSRADPRKNEWIIYIGYLYSILISRPDVKIGTAVKRESPVGCITILYRKASRSDKETWFSLIKPPVHAISHSYTSSPPGWPIAHRQILLVHLFTPSE